MEEPFHVALTGHRPTRLPGGYDTGHPFYERLSEVLRDILSELLDQHETVIAHSGMALGTDTVWAEVIVALKQDPRYQNNLEFLAEIPFPQQASKWPARAQEHWAELVEQADHRAVYASEYSNRALFTRNEKMIDSSDLLIAVWDGTSAGGTAGAVRYAQKKNVPVIVISPEEV